MTIQFVHVIIFSYTRLLTKTLCGLFYEHIFVRTSLFQQIMQSIGTRLCITTRIVTCSLFSSFVVEFCAKEGRRKTCANHLHSSTFAV